MMMEKENREDREVVGLRPVIAGYLLHWRLILCVGLFSFVPAVLYLVLYPRTYKTMARVQIQDNTNPMMSSGANLAIGEAAGLMRSFGLEGLASGGSIIIEDEIAAFTSNTLLGRMIYELGLYIDYRNPFSLYRLYEDKPLVVTCDSQSIACLENIIEFDVSVKKDGVKITTEIDNEDYKETFRFVSLPATVRLKEGDFTFDHTGVGRSAPHYRLRVTVNPLPGAADKLMEDLLIEELSKTSNVIEFTTTDYKRQRSKDIFNTLIKWYNRQENDYIRELGDHSLVFLNERIGGITAELAEVERSIETYKVKNRIMDIQMDGQYYTDYMKELQIKIIEAESRTNLVRLLDEFVKDSANRYKLAPTLITSSVVGQQIDISPLMSYNQALLERERLIKNAGIDNPMVTTLNVQIERLRENVYQMIDNAYRSTRMLIDDLQAKEKAMTNRMGEVPIQERMYVNFVRQQEILQGVYLILLQKREEVLLSMDKPGDKAKIMDAAFTYPKPVAPRKLFAAIGMVVFTLFVSTGWLYCKKQWHAFSDELHRLRLKE
jgi:uncharacterized protein involved in exopolysaccharide biosynthesis